MSDVLPVLKRTDFHHEVLLEDWPSDQPEGAASAKPRSATITEYQPNRVVVEVEDGDPGYLVLADVWYPGWRCTLDGEPAALYRANYLFRATPVSAGSHQIVFTFSPESYRLGKWISILTLVLVAGVGVGGRLAPKCVSFISRFRDRQRSRSGAGG
jgi:hypothetical protein